MSIDAQLMNEIYNKLIEYESLPTGSKYDFCEALLFQHDAVAKCNNNLDIGSGLFNKHRNMLIMALILKTIIHRFYTLFPSDLEPFLNELNDIYKILSAIDKQHISKNYTLIENHLFPETINNLEIFPKDVVSKIDGVNIAQNKNPYEYIDYKILNTKLTSYKLSPKKYSEYERWINQYRIENSQYLLYQLYDFTYQLIQLCANFISSLPELCKADDAYGTITNEAFKLCCLARNFYFILANQNDSKRCEFEGYNECNDKHLLKAYKLLSCHCHQIFYDYNKIFLTDEKHPSILETTLKVCKILNVANIYDIYFPDMLEMNTKKYKSFDVFESRQTDPNGESITVSPHKPDNEISQRLKKQYICFVNGLLLGYVPDTLNIKIVLKQFHSSNEFYLCDDIIPYDFSYAKSLSSDDFCYILDIKPSQYRDRINNLKAGLDSIDNISNISIRNLSNTLKERWPDTILFDTINPEIDKSTQYLPLVCYIKKGPVQPFYQFEIPQLFLMCFAEGLIKLLIREKSYSKLFSLLEKYIESLKKQDIKIMKLYLKYIVEKLYTGTTLFKKYSTNCIFKDNINNVKKLFVKFVQTRQNWRIIFPSYILNKVYKQVDFLINNDNNINEEWGDNIDFSVIMTDENKKFYDDIIEGRL